MLSFRELVGHQGAERLHRDVDRGVHDHQQPAADKHRGDEGGQVGSVGHQYQRQAGQQGSSQEVGTPAAQPVPGAVAEIADDGLHHHPGDGGHKPEPAKMLDIGAEGQQDPGCIPVLEGETELDPEESDTHVKNLSEGQHWLPSCGVPVFCHFHGSKIRNSSIFTA